MQYNRASRIKGGPKSKAVNLVSSARPVTNPVSAQIAGRVPFWADQKAYTAINIRLAHPKSVVANLPWASRFGEKETNVVAPKALQGGAERRHSALFWAPRGTERRRESAKKDNATQHETQGTGEVYPGRVGEG